MLALHAWGSIRQHRLLGVLWDEHEAPWRSSHFAPRWKESCLDEQCMGVSKRWYMV